MNEQQTADLFSEQIDRLLAGEAPGTTPEAEGLAELLNLGRQLSQVQFQAGPAVQTAFQSQLATWFGPVNGGSTSTILGLSKGWFIGLVAVMAGAGLVGLMTLLGTGSEQPTPQERLPSPEAVEQPASVPPSVELGQPATAEPTSPAESKETGPAASSTPEAPLQEPALGDSLPTAVPSTGDTIPSATPTVEPTDEVMPTNTPVDDDPPDGSATDSGDSDDDSPGSDDDPSGSGPPGGEDDQDRGHGNDPDGVDEDNPGRSEGSGGSDNDPPGGGGNDGGGNSGGGNSGSGGGRGGGKGNK